MTSKYLSEKIHNLQAKVCVIGLGQVGLPTALTFCKAGFDTTGHDINKNLLEALASGKTPFEEPDLQLLLDSCIQKGRFHTTHELIKAVETSDIIIVCIGTPLKEKINPDLFALEKICNSLSELSLNEKLVIIESSIPPGTFEGSVLPALRKKNNVGINCWASFVPERLAPGQAFKEIRSTPRVIGCVDNESGIVAKHLYEKIVDSEIFVTQARVAEISKLVENTFRDVNVALANEIGLICEGYGIDVNELLKICNSHPRVNLHQPGPGVGGPCLPKDPYLLLNAKDLEQFEYNIILQARKINDNMPFHVVKIVKNALEELNKSIKNSTVSILGVAYKANVSDTRFSPAENIISELIKSGSEVIVFDPMTKENFGGKSVLDSWSAISNSDVLVVVTDHDEFKTLDLEKIKNTMKTPIIVDCRRIFDRKKAESLGIHYLAVGYTKKLTH